MKTVTLPDGRSWPALGLGTWRMGESARSRAAEVAALRAALEMGYRLIDTAEMYADAELVVGQALAEAFRAGTCPREELIVISKVLPDNASRAGVVHACDRSRRRLGLDTLDGYLLHWPGPHPLAQTIGAFEALRERGAIVHWGVSNFDLAAMREVAALHGGSRCATNQVWYSLGRRGIEFDLLPWQRERSMPVMAYSPIDQGAMARHRGLAALAEPLGVTAAQLALAWTVRGDGVVAIPKAVRAEHLLDNLAAAGIEIDADTAAALDRLFPPPRRAAPLAIG